MHNNVQAFFLFFIVFPINFKHLFQFRTECVNVGNRLLFSDEPTFFYTQKLFAVLLLLFLYTDLIKSRFVEIIITDNAR